MITMMLRFAIVAVTEKVGMVRPANITIAMTLSVVTGLMLITVDCANVIKEEVQIMSFGDLLAISSCIYRIARKEHKCCECQLIIAPGDKYQIVKGCWEGKWEQYKTCSPCADLREEILKGCWDKEWPPFGDLGEWAREYGFEFPVK